MTPTELTESLTLALKLKSEVERVCHLLDEKDARIAALESELAAAVDRAITNTEDSGYWEQRYREKESELADLKLDYDYADGLLHEKTDECDRERSRREALEREVREHAAMYATSGPPLEWAADDLRAILDRSAEQDEPHTPDPEPEPPCSECGGSTRLIRHTLTYDFCGDCYVRLHLPDPTSSNDPEPVSDSAAMSEPLWIAAMREADRAHHYSGDRSHQFWDRVNALENPEKHAMYSCGVLLQNMEASVLRWLDQAEADQNRAAAVRRGEL